MRTEAEIQKIRDRIIEVVENCGKGHLGTSLSSLEAILAIRDIMKPDDVFISSKGHDALAQYAALVDKGILKDEDLDTFRTEGGLPGHPTVEVPGIAANTGSLGMGLSKALGFAISNPFRTVYCLLGDGELMEGQNWEAALAIANSGVTNIVALCDYNSLSQDGPTDLGWQKINEMFLAAGWKVRNAANGNSYEEVYGILEEDWPGRWLVVLHTTKGRGLQNEGQHDSHFGVPGREYPPHPSCDMLGGAILQLMKERDDVIVCGADTLRDLCLWRAKEEFPHRVFDFGIAEQNMVSFASAMALEGYVPIVATYACFLRRAFEQIYNQATEGTQVIYIGSMAGPLQPDGPGISHQSLDDALWMHNLGIQVFEVPVSHAGFIGAVLRGMVDSEMTSYLRLLHHD